MITVIGNRLNSVNKKVLERMNKRDFEFVRREVQLQTRQGAQYIEVNASSLLHNEIPFLQEALPLIEEAGGNLLVMSDNVDALVEALRISKREIIVGSVEYDTVKIGTLLPLLRDRQAKLVARVREKNDGNGHLYSPEKSLLIAQQYIDYLLDHGIHRGDILLDPQILPLEDGFHNGKIFLDTLELFKLDFPQVKTVANIFQLSEGLPKRHLLASYFLSLALSKGLDYVITNVLDDTIQEAIVTTFTIIGKDKHLQGYLQYCRNHKDGHSKGSKNGRSADKRDPA